MKSMPSMQSTGHIPMESIIDHLQCIGAAKLAWSILLQAIAPEELQASRSQNFQNPPATTRLFRLRWKVCILGKTQPIQAVFAANVCTLETLSDRVPSGRRLRALAVGEIGFGDWKGAPRADALWRFVGFDLRAALEYCCLKHQLIPLKSTCDTGILPTELIDLSMEGLNVLLGEQTDRAELTGESRYLHGQHV